MSRRLLKSPDGQEIRERIVPARMSFAGEAAGFARAASAPAGFSRKRLDSLEMTVEEAFGNVASKGYGERPGSIRLVVSARPGEVEVQIWDRGEPFDPECYAAPDAPEKEGAVRLRQSRAEEMAYRREEDQNLLVLRFLERP